MESYCQPSHKVIQVTERARESSLNNYDEITVSGGRELSHIASGYEPAQFNPARHLRSLQHLLHPSTTRFGAGSLTKSIQVPKSQGDEESSLTLTLIILQLEVS